MVKTATSTMTLTTPIEAKLNIFAKKERRFQALAIFLTISSIMRQRLARSHGKVSRDLNGLLYHKSDRALSVLNEPMSNELKTSTSGNRFQTCCLGSASV